MPSTRTEPTAGSVGADAVGKFFGALPGAMQQKRENEIQQIMTLEVFYNLPPF